MCPYTGCTVTPCSPTQTFEKAAEFGIKYHRLAAPLATVSFEEIAGHEEYRNDLALLYLPEFAVPSGSLMALSMRPFRMQNFRLNCASTAEAAWLQAMLDRESARFGTHVAGKSDGTLSAVW